MFINDNETQVDMLYFSSIAKTIVKLISKSSDAPMTIGIHGDWGAGKSSVLAMTENTIAEEQNIKCIRFNSWQFEGYEDAKAVLIEDIITKLRDIDKENETVVDKAKSLLKRVDYFKLLKKGAGIGISLATGIPNGDIITGIYNIIDKAKNGVNAENVENIINEAGGYLKPKIEEKLPEQMREFQKEFQELIEATGVEKLVVIVDDLDRCLPSTAIETLEAIRLFLFAKKTVFIIAADETMIEYSVKKHFPDLPTGNGPITYARNYLEKLIQIPFRIPALGEVETQIYVSLTLIQAQCGDTDENFKKLLDQAREILCKPWEGLALDSMVAKKCLNLEMLPETIEQSIILSSQIYKILTDGTKGNPRQIKRFLNSLLLRSEIAEARGFGGIINRPVLAKILLTETYNPSFYEQITQLSYSSVDGKPIELKELEGKAKEYISKSVIVPENITSLEGSEKLSKWLENEWIVSWAKISPSLIDVDLRPYVFITRDKKSFLGNKAVSNYLDSYVEKLMGGELSCRSIELKLKELNSDELEYIYDMVQAQIREKDSYKDKPHGLVMLAKINKKYQKGFLEFLKRTPVEKLGMWVVNGLRNVFTEEFVAKEYEEFCKRLGQQDKNITLKKAINSFGKQK